MSKRGEFLQAMLEYAEAHGLQVAQIGTAFRGKRPDYCIVDDDLQPVQGLEAYLDSQPIRRTEPALIQPTENTTMKSLRSVGLLASIMGMLPSIAYTNRDMYGHPMQVQPDPQLIASRPDKPRRRNHTNGGTHKQNLRASKRKGKSYKVRAQRRAA